MNEVDARLGPTLHRDLTFSSTTPETFAATDLLDSGFRLLIAAGSGPAPRLKVDPSDTDRPFAVHGRRSIELRAWTTMADNSTAIATLFGWPHTRGNPGDALPQGYELGILNFVFGTRTIANLNPVTNEAVSSTTFRSADQITLTEVAATDPAKLTGYQLYDADPTGGNRSARIVFDPQGLYGLYVKITNTSASSGRILISLRPLG